MGDVRDSELDANPSLVLTAAVGLPVDVIGTLTDAVARIDGVLTPRLAEHVE